MNRQTGGVSGGNLGGTSAGPIPSLYPSAPIAATWDRFTLTVQRRDIALLHVTVFVRLGLGESYRPTRSFFDATSPACLSDL